MNVLEFVTWWLSQDNNGEVIIVYILISSTITMAGFIGSVWIGGFLMILFGTPLVFLLVYVINKEIRKTYNTWRRIK